ncbi:hypothetical protein RQN30_10895 [Arcanobacterium hippocoleae]
MTIIYYIAVAILALAGIIFVGAAGLAITHIIRHPNDRSVQDLEGPLREYLLNSDERAAAEAAVANTAAKLDGK